MTKINTSDFLKASDLNGDTTAIFVNEGVYVKSQFKDANDNPRTNFNIKIRIGDDEKTWTMNKTSQKAVAESYGNETSLWLHKPVILKKLKMMVGNTMKDVVMGEPLIGEAAGPKWEE